MLRLSAIMLAALLVFEPILFECCDDFSCHILIGSYAGHQFWRAPLRLLG
jgi:hypothetical protein